MIDNYCILGKKSYSDGYYFITGFKTLKNLRKKFCELVKMIGSEKHDEIFYPLEEG